MDQYFKLIHAREEIERLNIEIKRVVTHMRDEELFLVAAEKKAAQTDSTLAFHIGNYRLQRIQFFHVHRRNFEALTALPGFTGTITPGTSIDPTLTKNLHDDSLAMDVDGSELLKVAQTVWHEEEGGEENEDDAKERHRDDLDPRADDDLQTAFMLLQIAQDW